MSVGETFNVVPVPIKVPLQDPMYHSVVPLVPIAVNVTLLPAHELFWEVLILVGDVGFVMMF